MKKQLLIALLSALLPVAVRAQYEADTENGVVSLAGREGFSIETKKGDFVFKPYLLVQASAHYNWYDDEGLDPAYNQDNVANSGFAIPYAVLGFTGKAFDKVTFNLSLNAAASGGALLQQAWFDVAFKPQLALRVGKFKTPFSHAYLTTLGESLLPQMPLSLTTSVIMPYSLNAVMPGIGTGFDLGLGLYYWHRNWWAGFSVTHLTAPSVDIGETQSFKIDRTYYLTGGYNIRLRNPFLTIHPSAMARYDGAAYRVDVTARVKYTNDKKVMYAGVGCSPTNSVTVMVGGNFHGVSLGYSYEVYTSAISIGNGSHEIFIGYQTDMDLGKKGRNKHKSVRIL